MKNIRNNDENIFNLTYKNMELIKILLELEKEVRNRFDISAVMFGLIFAGGTYLIVSNVPLRKELLGIFIVIMSLLIPYKLVVLISIIERIEEIEDKLSIKKKYKKRQLYLILKIYFVSLLILLIIFTFLY